MDEIEQRIEVLRDSAFVDEKGEEDLKAMVRILTEDYGIDRSSDLLGSLVTHVAAAIRRSHDGEAINPLSKDIVSDVRASEVFPKAKEIEDVIMEETQTVFSEDEEDFILVHIDGLLTSVSGEGKREGRRVM